MKTITKKALKLSIEHWQEIAKRCDHYNDYTLAQEIKLYTYVKLGGNNLSQCCFLCDQSEEVLRMKDGKGEFCRYCPMKDRWGKKPSQSVKECWMPNSIYRDWLEKPTAENANKMIQALKDRLKSLKIESLWHTFWFVVFWVLIVGILIYVSNS